MPKVSSKKQRMANLSKLAAKAKETTSPQNVTVSLQPMLEEMEVDQIVEISQPIQNTVELAWNSEAQASTQREAERLQEEMEELTASSLLSTQTVQPEADIEPAINHETQVEDALVRLYAFVAPRTTQIGNFPNG
ncbi:hypothetical protein EDC96DRAFT_581775 [Choanephora cucurbitarum]|nr:hypothetical protein EDC96DRAFT_581775 [Choanephora cucurbitarum]